MLWFGQRITIFEETEEFLESTENDLLKQVSVLYNNMIEGSVSADKICSDNVIVKISEAIAEKKEQLKYSRTAKLWLQYMDMIDILRKYIRAERTGNWELHLQTLSKMLPFLAASGHNNYTKCVWIYLQPMSLLQDHQEVYEHFKKGLHVIRRSDRYWAGLSSDLAGFDEKYEDKWWPNKRTRHDRAAKGNLVIGNASMCRS